MLELLSREQKFTGAYPILVTAFLARVKRDFDNALMPEHMPVIRLSGLLGKPTESAFEAQRGYFRLACGTRTGAEAYHWLLCTYVTDSATSRAVYGLRDTRQNPNETEGGCSARLRETITRWGDV